MKTITEIRCKILLPAQGRGKKDAKEDLLGTTALLKILLECGVRFRGTIGLPEYRHSVSFPGSLAEGRASQGIFGNGAAE